MLSLELKIYIQEYKKATIRKKSNFFFSAFIYDILCAEFEYPNLGWKCSFSAPPLPIYYSELWDTNYAPRFYDICQYFLGTIYFLIFKKEAPAFSPEATGLIGTMGDWYVGENFSYIRIWGRNTVHMLPRIVLDRLVLEELVSKLSMMGFTGSRLALREKLGPNSLCTLDYRLFHLQPGL